MRTAPIALTLASAALVAACAAVRTGPPSGSLPGPRAEGPPAATGGRAAKRPPRTPRGDAARARAARAAPPAAAAQDAAPAVDVWAEPATWRAAGDPSQFEVPLPAGPGWNASLVLDNGTTGIWTVEAFQVFPMYGTPEVVGLDDKGRCHVLSSYSGKWADMPTIHDVKWLGGLAHADVDPRFPGPELYTGGERGNLYQVRSYEQAALDHRLIAFLPGMEIHTLVAGDLDPRTPGAELFVFTRPGGLYRATPTGPDGGFEIAKIDDLPGRVRDAVVLPREPGRPAEIACVSRAGWVRILSVGMDGPHWETVYEDAMGMGRIDVRAGAPGEPLVLYTCHDDGRVLRLERQPDRTFRSELVYLGPQGTRGVASGRFDADPSVETIAIFGYSGRVEILSRRADGWHAETAFTDRSKGHWLVAAELDGRNATTELLASGYGARIVLLARPPGTGRAETSTDIAR